MYDRLGGIFVIADLVDYFSDRIIKDPLIGKDSPNPHLRNWSRNQLNRLPGLKSMRTLWLADITGGPYKFVPTRTGSTHLGLENAHRNFRISPDEFDRVALILGESLDHFQVPAQEKKEVLNAFAAHKNKVTTGYFQPNTFTVESGMIRQ